MMLALGWLLLWNSMANIAAAPPALPASPRPTASASPAPKRTEPGNPMPRPRSRSGSVDIPDPTTFDGVDSALVKCQVVTCSGCKKVTEEHELLPPCPAPQECPKDCAGP